MKNENPIQFESRKQDHVRIAMDPKTQSSSFSKLDRINLIHEALPEINFQDVTIATKPFGVPLKSPLFISSMTAGHQQGREINLRLAESAQAQGWMMGVGSQRKELSEGSAGQEAAAEWKLIRKTAPKAILFGNLGLSQLIQTPLDEVYRLIDSLEASGFFVHTNPLQEALQPEGTPQFKGGLKALSALADGIAKRYQIPLVLKEVGCGFSAATLQKLQSLGLAAVDVSGLGGTHWGRVETERMPVGELKNTGQTYSNWGISTVDSLLFARELKSQNLVTYQIWASGGVRSGLDAAKLIALGSEMVGLAQPLLQAVLTEMRTQKSALIPLMQRLEQELKIALFCTGCESLEVLRQRGQSDSREKGIWTYE